MVKNTSIQFSESLLFGLPIELRSLVQISCNDCASYTCEERKRERERQRESAKESKRESAKEIKEIERRDGEEQRQTKMYDRIGVTRSQESSRVRTETKPLLSPMATCRPSGEVAMERAHRSCGQQYGKPNI